MAEHWSPEPQLGESLFDDVPRLLASQKPNGQFGTDPWICRDQNVLLPLSAAWCLEGSPYYHSDEVLTVLEDLLSEPPRRGEDMEHPQLPGNREAALRCRDVPTVMLRKNRLVDSFLTQIASGETLQMIRCGKGVAVEEDDQITRGLLKPAIARRTAALLRIGRNQAEIPTISVRHALRHHLPRAVSAAVVDDDDLVA